MFENLHVGTEVHYQQPNGSHSKATVTRVNNDVGVVDLSIARDDDINIKYTRKAVVYRDPPQAYSWHFVGEQCPKAEEQAIADES